jgi:hypothetical protein
MAHIKHRDRGKSQKGAVIFDKVEAGAALHDWVLEGLCTMLVARPYTDMADRDRQNELEDALNRLEALSLDQNEHRAALLMDISELISVSNLTT